MFSKRNLLRKYAQQVFALDLRSLALFRIALGAILLWDLSVRATDLEAHYTDWGVLTRDALWEATGRSFIQSLHFLGGSLGFQALLFGLAGIFALALLLGYRTRWMTILSWLFLSSLQLRNPGVLQGGDFLLRLFLFWSIFLPLGEHFSLDALRKAGRNPPTCVASLASFCFFAQIFLVYFCSALQKSGVEWHEEGSAIYYALNLDLLATDFGSWLLQFENLLRISTHFVWYLELLGMFLFLVPRYQNILRPLGIFLFIGFHLGIAASIDIGIFPFVSSAGFLALIPSSFWRPASSGTASLEPESRLQRAVLRSLLTMSLLVVILWNAKNVWPRLRLPAPVVFYAESLNLDQNWNMFAPFPLKRDGWFIGAAQTEMREEFDLLRFHFENARLPIQFEKPARISRSFPNQRWRKLFMNLNEKDWPLYARGLAEYYCRDWNRDPQVSDRLKQIELIFMHEQTPKPGEPQHIKRRPLFRYYCPKIDP